jgi:hypothetical protein
VFFEYGEDLPPDQSGSSYHGNFHGKGFNGKRKNTSQKFIILHYLLHLNRIKDENQDMKQLFTLLFLASTLAAGAQFSDSFTDGDFTDDPQWTGDATLFEVNASNQLHLVATSADTAFLSTVNTTLAGAEWRFWLKMSFNTSANNHARIYLVSDRQELKGPLNGYFLQAGGSSDSVAFYRQEGMQLTRLYRSPRLYTGHSVNAFRFRITRDDAGTWEIQADSTGGDNYCSEGVFFDNTVDFSSYFGVWCKFTSSNASKFYFDDFYAGPIITDTLPPAITRIQMEGNDSLRLFFTEALDSVSAGDPSNYRLLSTGLHPVTATRVLSDPACVVLEFGSSFPEPSCDSLMTTGIADPAGNLMTDTVAFFCHYHPRAFDVVINEILADPEPAVSLPPSEFTELYNRSAYPVCLKGWAFQSGSYTKQFPDVTIPPSSYLILSQDTGYSSYGELVLLFTSSYSLPNEGSSLVLRDETGRVIHWVNYTADWFGGSFKKEGGWSLELVDPADPCGCSGNWIASEAVTGGTPGSMNSVRDSHPDTTAPVLLRAAIRDSEVIEVTFSEAMDSVTLKGTGSWMINDTLLPGTDITLIPPDYRIVRLRKATGFGNGSLYEVRPPAGASDCAGNLLPANSSVTAIIPEVPESGDIVINEILADPWPGASRFIELFNRSGRSFDLKDITIQYLSSDTGTAADGPAPFAVSPFLLMPLEYGVACEECEEVIIRYNASFPGRFQSMAGFPALGKESGGIVIARLSDGETIDRVDYSAAMHHPLLSSAEGISLERVSPDAPSQDHSNWHSAASAAGFATPGDRNSQWWDPGEEGAGEVTIDPPVFSPDNDGKDDLLHIICRPGAPGFMATVLLFDSRGRRVRQLAGNVLIPSEGIFTWDGTTEENKRASTGIYLVYIELVRTDGEVKKFKHTVVVAAKF